MPSVVQKPTVRPFTVLVEGNIGCGKTTFLQYFSKFNNVEVLKEPVERWRNVDGHNLLQLMYEDPERYSMPFQSYVQLTMLDQHLAATDRPVKLMERSIFSARYCFVENLYRTGKMQASEFEVLRKWFEFFSQSPELDLKVDLIIYLRTNPETALERVKERARGEENCIPLEYLTELHHLHEEWLTGNKFPLPAPVLVIDANQDRPSMEKEYIKHEDNIFGHLRKDLMRDSLTSCIEMSSPAAV